MTRPNESNIVPADTSQPVDDDSIEKKVSLDEKADVEHAQVLDSEEDFAGLDDMARLDNDKVLETAKDFSVALVSLEDDPTLPINTFRMWFCGLGFAGFGAVLGMLFQFRPQVITVSALFLQILIYMFGRTFETVIPGPGHRWHKNNWFWNFMNPGPFNIKEHVASQIMANTASVAAFANYVFASDDLFYNIQVNAGNAIFTLWASQLIGYGLAGIFRSFLVYPTAMLYPLNLIYVNLFDGLHRSKGAVLQGKRIRFFWILTGAVFVYEWFPEYIAPLLGSFNIVCLAARDSTWVSYIFGGAEANEGMGLMGFGLDWANITSAPFYQPLATQIGIYVGWAINYILLPLVFAKNVFNSQNFPFISQNLFFENGTIYDQSLILNADFSLNKTALEIYGHPWQSGSTVIYNMGLNLAISATVVHVALWHGREIWSHFRDYMKGGVSADVHYLAMQKYPEVPIWWYLGLFVVAFIVAIVTSITEHSHLPVWAFIVAVIFAFLMLPFYGAFYAVAGTVTSFTNLFQIFGSALIPGSSQANMYFELYSSNTLKQSVALLSDLKLGQYTKLPPRWTFYVQCTGTIVGSLLNFVVMNSVVTNERTILLDNQGSRVWSGQQIQSFNANAILWGSLGKEIYSRDGPYFIVPLCLVIGLGVPVLPWLLYKKTGWDWLRLVNMPLIAANIGDLAGGTNGYINTWMAIGLTSHFYIRKYRARWFKKYNYLFGAAIDGGSQIFVFIFSFALAGAGGVTVPFPNWALNPVGNADYCKVTET